MGDSEFVFDYVNLLYYKCYKINLNRGGSYIDSPDWIKNKKETINPINKNVNKCFQYAITVGLNYEEIGKHAERITKIKPFINKYNWEAINYPSEIDDWKKIEKNNVKIALNVLYAKKKIYPSYVSKHNSNCEKQVILLLIPNREGWYYLAVKKPAALLRGITFKHHVDFYCLNCFHSFVTKNKLQSHKRLCFCNIIMLFQVTKILEFNQYQKSDKAPFIIYEDLMCRS